jgi:hypothetical protein
MTVFASDANAQHSATVTIVASVTPGISGYNWHRSTTVGGVYTKITLTPLAPLSFTDTTVQAGQTYFYKASAVCPTGGCSGGATGESVLSAASGPAIIPTDRPEAPNAPVVTSVQ